MWTGGTDGQPAVAPRSAELAFSALRLAGTHYRDLIAPLAIALVPVLAVGGVAVGIGSATSRVHGARNSTVELAEVVALVAAVLWNFVSQAAAARAVIGASVAAPADWRASLRLARSQWAAIAVAALCVSVGAGIGFLLVIPGFVLWLTWYVTVPVIVVERIGTRAAMRRSASLVAGRRLTIFGAFILVEFVVLACALPASAIVGVFLAHSAATQVVAEQVAAYVVEVLLTPLQVALVLVVYLDLRVRGEGITPVALARAAGIVAPAPVVAPGGWTPPDPPVGESSALPPSPPGDQPAHGLAAPGWAPVSPKPSVERGSTRPDASWPEISPKPVPPAGRTRPRPAPDADSRAQDKAGPEL